MLLLSFASSVIFFLFSLVKIAKFRTRKFDRSLMLGNTTCICARHTYKKILVLRKKKRLIGRPILCLAIFLFSYLFDKTSIVSVFDIRGFSR